MRDKNFVIGKFLYQNKMILSNHVINIIESSFSDRHNQ